MHVHLSPVHMEKLGRLAAGSGVNRCEMIRRMIDREHDHLLFSEGTRCHASDSPAIERGPLNQSA